jgi:WD40 repeat protein
MAARPPDVGRPPDAGEQDGKRADDAASHATALRQLAQRWQASGLLLPADPALAGRPPADGTAAPGAEPYPGLRAVTDLLGPPAEAPEIGDEARVMVLLTALLLAGATRRARPVVRVAVVFGLDDRADARQPYRGQGASGYLELREFPAGPAGLYPDPQAMAAVQSPGPDFARSLAVAWRSAPPVRPDACVLWRIVPEGGRPLPALRGPSLGAAFAVALRDLLRYPAGARPSAAWLRGFFHGFRSGTAITGAVTETGQLAPVGDLAAKFAAASSRRWRLVVPAANRGELRLAPEPAAVDLAATITQADGYLRRWRKGRMVAVAAAIALVASAVTVPRLVVDATSARRLATQQQALAVSNKLAGLALSNLSTHVNIAQLLAVEATRIDNTPQARAALFQAAYASPGVQRYLPVGAPVSALAASADGSVVVAGTSTGDLVRIDVATGRRTEVGAGHGLVTAVAVSASGDTVAAISGSTSVLWRASTGRRPSALGRAGPGAAVAVSPSGTFAAALTPLPLGADAVLVRDVDVATGRDRTTRVADLSNPLFRPAFRSDSALLLTSGTGAYVQLDPASLRVVSHSNESLTPPAGYTTGLSANGAWSGYLAAGNITTWPTTITSTGPLTIAQENRFRDGTAPGGETQSLVISPSGQLAATLLGGSIYLSPLGGPLGSHPAATDLTASAGTTLLSFLGADRLVSADGSEVALYYLGALARLDPPTDVGIPGVSFAPGTPQLSVSPDGRGLAIFSGNAGTLSLYRLSSMPTSVPTLVHRWRPRVFPQVILWRGDQPLLAGGATQLFEVSSAAGRILASWPGEGTARVIAAAAVDQGGKLAMVTEAGIRVYSAATGTSTMHRMHVGALSGLTNAEQMSENPAGTGAVLVQDGTRAVYLDLRTGASHVVGSGPTNAAALGGRLLLVQRYSSPAGTASVQEWNATGTHLLRTLALNAAIGQMTLSPDGSLLGSISDQGVASVVDPASGTTLASFTLPSSQTSAPEPSDLTAFLFTPDRRYLLTATPGGVLSRWDIGEGDLIKVACARAGTSLTRAQWAQYVGSAPPANLSCLR